MTHNLEVTEVFFSATEVFFSTYWRYTNKIIIIIILTRKMACAWMDGWIYIAVDTLFKLTRHLLLTPTELYSDLYISILCDSVVKIQEVKHSLNS